MLASLYYRSPRSAPPLRIGVLLDSRELGVVFARVLEDIQAAQFTDLRLAVFNGEYAPGPVTNVPKPLWRRRLDRLLRKDLRRRFLFDLYEYAQRGVFGQEDHPLHPVDCSGLIAAADKITVAPIVKGFTHRFPEADLERIRSYGLDVLLRFGFAILRGGVLSAARFGMWSYHHGDNTYYRGGPPHFWEIVEGNPESGVILQVLTEELDAGQVLAKVVCPTQGGVFYSRNQITPYWAARHLVIQKLWELHAYGWEEVDRRKPPPEPYRGKRKIYRAPGNGDMVRWLGPAIARKVLSPNSGGGLAWHWQVALCRSGPPLLDRARERNWSGDFQWIESPRGRFYADPCLCADGDRTWLFVEDYSYHEGRARLSFAEVNQPGDRLEFAPCLEEPFHLSYPVVFPHEGAWFMIPESGRAGEVRLYCAPRPAGPWKLEKVLYKMPAVDTTPYFDGGQWWFFTSIPEPPGSANPLLLFRSDTLTGDWQYHPANPVTRHARFSRNAGPLVLHQRSLYRPSQSCIGGYGRSFALHQVLELNGAGYEERLAAEFLPDWPAQTGTHTYTAAGPWQAIDGCFPRPRKAVW